MEMKTFEAEAPDGTPFRFVAPANSTPEQLQQIAAAEYRNQKSKAAPEPEVAPPEAPASSPQPNLASQAVQKVQQETGMGAGAAAGTLGGLGLGVLESKGAGPASILEKMTSGAQAAMPPAPPPTPPVGGLPGPSGEQQVSRILQGTTGDMGTTGRARMQGFNVETAQQAARAREAEQLLANLQRQGLVGSSSQQVLAQAPGLTSTPSGVLAPRAPVTPPPASSGPLQEVTQMFKNMAERGVRTSQALGGAARAVPVLSYPLAGYSAGRDIEEIQRELQSARPDYADIVLRGAGVLGTGMSLHPLTAPLGVPLAVGAPLVAAARKKFQAEAKQPEATYEELVRASRPAFRYSRP